MKCFYLFHLNEINKNILALRFTMLDFWLMLLAIIKQRPSIRKEDIIFFIYFIQMK